MPRTKKEIPMTDKEWLNTEPEVSEIELTPYGGYHIPIEKLRPLLDRLNATVRNYRSVMYKNGYAELHAYGSVEITVLIDGIERTVTGAYNLNVLDAPNGFWNGTLKSDCIKNAALELGVRFGRNLNKIAPQSATPQASTETIKEKLKAMPDSKIMQQYLSAVERGDEAAIATLINIYEIKL